MLYTHFPPRLTTVTFQFLYTFYQNLIFLWKRHFYWMTVQLNIKSERRINLALARRRWLVVRTKKVNAIYQIDNKAEQSNCYYLIVMSKFSTFLFNKVMLWHEWGEVENVHIAYNFSYFVIYLPRIIKIDGNLTKFWLKQFVQFLLRHGVYTYVGPTALSMDTLSFRRRIKVEVTITRQCAVRTLIIAAHTDSKVRDSGIQLKYFSEDFRRGHSPVSNQGFR